MILIVALRGGHGHSIVNVTSCSWEYWLAPGQVKALDFKAKSSSAGSEDF